MKACLPTNQCTVPENTKLLQSAFSGEIAKGEWSFEQWNYEVQTLCKSYSDSALREGIQHSLRGAPANAVHNMGPNVPLDMILK